MNTRDGSTSFLYSINGRPASEPPLNTQRTPLSSGIVAVVTSFNPDESLLRVCGSVERQVERVVIVDDGSSDGQSVLQLCRDRGWEVLKLEENLGIAKALNVGIDAAITGNERLTYVLTLDQDSWVPDRYVESMLGCANQARIDGIEVGLIAPGKIDSNSMPKRHVRGKTVLGRNPIQSGLMIPLKTIHGVGAFTESLFIDCVDTEYYIRCVESGRETVVCETVVLGHRIGQVLVLEILGHKFRRNGRIFTVLFSEPFRYYYITRNRLLVTRQFGWRHKRWAFNGLTSDLKHILLLLLFVPGRARNMRFLMLGVLDGLRGRVGSIPHKFQLKAAKGCQA